MALLTKIALGPDAGFTDLDAQLVPVAGGGDSFNMQGNEIVVVNNQNGGTCTVTFVASGPDNFNIVNAAHNLTLAIPTTKRGIFVLSQVARWKDTNGLMQITYSLSATVTIGIFVPAMRAT